MNHTTLGLFHLELYEKGWLSFKKCLRAIFRPLSFHVKNDCGPDIYLSFIQSFDHMIELDPQVWSFHTYLPPILKPMGVVRTTILDSGPSFGMVVLCHARRLHFTAIFNG